MDSSSESEGSAGTGGSRLEWEVVGSDPDSGCSEANHDEQLHEHDVHVHPQHFGNDDNDNNNNSQGQTVQDWIEPSVSEENLHHQDMELLSSLVSSVLEGSPGKAELDDGLQKEVLAESGFSSLVPQDVHGNVLRPEEQEQDEGTEHETALGTWKSKVSMWRECIKRASTIWSITIAAALMGLVILGQRWHHERWQNHHLRMQLCYKDEKISQLLFQIARLKESVSGRRRVPVIKSSST